MKFKINEVERYVLSLAIKVLEYGIDCENLDCDVCCYNINNLLPKDVKNMKYRTCGIVFVCELLEEVKEVGSDD